MSGFTRGRVTQGETASLSGASVAVLMLVMLLIVFNLTMLFDSDRCGNEMHFNSSTYCFGGRLFTATLNVKMVCVITSVSCRFFLELKPITCLVSVFLSNTMLFMNRRVGNSGE